MASDAVGHLTVNREEPVRARPGAPKHMRSGAVDLHVGDQYVVEWAPYDRQHYRVEAVRGDYIVYRRWISTKGKWTDWQGVQRASLLDWSRVRKVDDADRR